MEQYGINPGVYIQLKRTPGLRRRHALHATVSLILCSIDLGTAWMNSASSHMLNKQRGWAGSVQILQEKVIQVNTSLYSKRSIPDRLKPDMSE